MSEHRGDPDERAESLPRPVDPPPPPPGRRGVDLADEPGEPPAPVVTEEGAYGDLPPLYEIEDYKEVAGDWRRSLTWAAAIGLAIVGALWALAFTAEQATSRTVAIPVLERGIEALTGLEDLLVIHEETIRDTAEGAAPVETIDVPGYLVHAASLSALDVREGGPPEWYPLLIRRSAEAAYIDGLAIFHEEGAPETGGIFSTSGTIERIVNTLSERRHAQASRAAELLTFVVLALVAVVLLVGRGTQRFVAAGAALIAAAGLVALGGLLTMAVVAFVTSDESALGEQFAWMSMTLARMPLQTALYLAVAGALILLPAALVTYVLAALSRRRRDEGDSMPESHGA